MNYEEIKLLAKQLKVRREDLLALAPANDPFYVGQPAQIMKAHWFADLWHAMNLPAEGVHLRRVHYRIISQREPVAMPKHAPFPTYRNDDKNRCWKYLNDASKYARYLELIPFSAFVDKRTPAPHIWTNYSSEDKPGYMLRGADYHYLPYVPELPELPDLDSVNWPELVATGYHARQYHVEVWAEKTTVDDELLPICQRHEVNLITGAGEMSITSCLDFLARVQRSGMPARILYVSDFDAAGAGMPISVAVKVQYFQQEMPEFTDLDIRLQPVVLTAEQVERFQLPRAPAKKSDKRTKIWEARHGPGVTELDALAELMPGTLEEIVEDAILSYRDADLQRKANEVRASFQQHLDELEEEALADIADEREAVQREYDELSTAYEATQEAFAELVEPFQAQLEAYHARLEELNERASYLQENMVEALREVEPDMPDFSMPAPDVRGIDSTLFASERSYLEQFPYFKEYRESGTINGHKA